MFPRLLKCLIIIIFLSIQFQAQQILKNDPYDITYEENVVLIKINDDVEVRKTLGKGIGNINTGIGSIDQILNSYKIIEMNRLFKSSKLPIQKKLFKDYYGNEHEVGRLDKIYKLRYEQNIDAKDLAEILSSDENIEYAEPDYHVKACDTYPDDPLYVSNDQWHINAVNAPAAWDLTTGDAEQILAIIDTGVDWLHPDLNDNIWINDDEIPDNGIDDDGNGYIDDVRGWDFVNNDNNPMDDNSHGTHVAGIAAAEGNNGVGVCGINWHAKIMPIKMLQSSGRGNSSDLAAAIEYASDNGADVTNMSLGSYGESITVKTALENAYAITVLVAAAGNSGYKVDPPYPPYPPYFPHYPACYGFVIGVEASTQTNTLTGFSNYDPSGPVSVGNSFNHNYEVRAPGVGIQSTFPNGGYKSLSGTSMASPIVAGAVSLIKLNNPSQSTEEIFAKLIQGSSGGILDIYNSMQLSLEPDIEFISFTIVDTLEGCDRDGIADAGETIEIYVTVKNAGGAVSGVATELELGEFEDPSVATIIKNTSTIGSISTYATMTSELDPFQILIDPQISNNRDLILKYRINFNEILKEGNILLTCQKGVELYGLIDSNLTLSPDLNYFVSDHLVVNSDDTLFIQPGTELQIANDARISIWGTIIAEGTPDSMIQFVPLDVSIGGLEINNGILKYCSISGINYDGFGIKVTSSNILFENCTFENNYANWSLFSVTFIDDIPFNQCNFYYNNCQITQNSSNYLNLTNCNIIKNELGYYAPVTINNSAEEWNQNNIFNNKGYNIYMADYGSGVYYIDGNNYFGSSIEQKVLGGFCDYFCSGSGGIISLEDFDIKANKFAHGIVWKVEINGIDPQDEELDPLGSETVKFDVYFNRAMDISETPFLTFGVREPYTQHVVIENSSWSADSTIWTAYYTFGLETGDGINTIRVANARDDEYFEIPIEDSRFKFVLQAAGAASIDFIATAGIGKVDLEWPEANTDDILGYNIYRYEMIDEVTSTDTSRINTNLITDLTFTDFNVTPDNTYRYLYKILGTDMAESDYSKVVSATPFDAANGDANGDLSVNVLDITTIVNHLLNKNPQPFLIDAADVNDDGVINVLDIVAAVNIIMGTNSLSKIYTSDEDVKISHDGNSVKLVNAENVTAIQLKIACNGIRDGILTPEELIKNMEYGYNIIDDTLYAVIFNLGNKSIGMKSGKLFSLSNGDIKDILSVTVSNQLGNEIITDVKSENELIPAEYELYQNFPNPFNPTTTIRYGIPKVSNVEFYIYNILGQKIKTLNFPQQNIGYHEIIWNGSNDYNSKVASGVYIYQIKAGKYVSQKKMVFLK